MQNPKVSLIASISQNRVIGRNNDLVWRIPEDLKRFRRLTENHAIIMGRKTFQSIGRPLPNRTNIIISRDSNFDAPGCIVAHSFNEALVKAQETETGEIFVIGGGQIFQEAIAKADKLYLTIIDQETAGDVYFPAYPNFKTVATSETKVFQGLRFWHEDLERI